MAQLGLNDVWREAAQRVERQAGVFFTIAAAFLMLPSVAVFLLHPEIAQMSGRAVTVAEVRQTLPTLAVSTLIQLFGQLAIIAVATDGGRSTVSQALHRAFGALPRAILGFLLLGFGVVAIIFLASLIVGVPLMMATGGATLDPRRVSALLAIGLLIPCIYFGLRFSLFIVGLVAARAGVIDALKDSWRATRGHAFAIFLILALSFVALLGLQGLVGLVFGGAARLIDAMLGSGGVPQFFAQVVGAAVGAVASTYITMLLVVVRRRLPETTEA